MSKIEETITLQGKSGTNYVFRLYDLNGELPQYASLYALVKLDRKIKNESTSEVAYIGTTKNLRSSFQTSNIQSVIEQTGANWVAVHQDTNRQIRVRKADDLVCRLTPVGNRQPDQEK